MTSTIDIPYLWKDLSARPSARPSTRFKERGLNSAPFRDVRQLSFGDSPCFAGVVPSTTSGRRCA